MALVLYLPAVRYGFIRDDQELIVQNLAMRMGGNLTHLLASDFWGSAGHTSGLWRPLILLSFWLDGRLAGWGPGWFHLVNVLWHAGASALLAAVVLGTYGGMAAAWFAGLWFAIMPVHLETVAWVAGRTDLWCGAFGLAALGCVAAQRRGPAGLWLGPTAFGLALLSKETGLVLLPVLGAALWLRSRDGPGEAARWLASWAPYLAIAAIYLGLHAVATSPSAVRPPLAAAPLPIRAATAVELLPRQLAFFLPGHPHGPDWRFEPSRGGASGILWLGLLLHSVLGWATWVSLRRKSRASLPLLLGWFPLLIMDSAAVRGLVFTGERQLYLSSAGWAWLGGSALSGVLRRWPSAGRPAVRVGVRALAVCWLGLAAHATWIGLPGWCDEATMYGAMRRAQPRNAMGWIGSALGSIRAGRDEDAARALDHATRLDRDRPEIPLLRAGIELRRGRALEALPLAREVLAREGWDRDAALLEVLALQRLERWRESSALIARLHDLLPADAGVTAAWARQALVEGRPGDVVTELGRRSPVGGEAADLPQLLGEAYARLGEWTLARAAFERSVSLDPGRYEAWLGLAAASELAADSASARAALERARRLPEASDGRAGRMLERLVGRGR